VIRYTQKGDEKSVWQIIPVAGTFPSLSLDDKTALLADGVQGVRIEFHGQVYQEQRQSSIIEMLCDQSVDVIRLPNSTLMKGGNASRPVI
jgi:hypothetical protein